MRDENKEKKTPLHLVVENGHKEVARLLIEANSDVCLYLNNYGKSPLHMAVKARYNYQIHFNYEFFFFFLTFFMNLLRVIEGMERMSEREEGDNGCWRRNDDDWVVVVGGIEGW